MFLLRCPCQNKIANEEVKPILCIICREVKSYENCRIVEEILHGILKTLLFKRTVEVNRSAICNTCYTKVFEAFRFKRICTNTEDSLFPYVDSEDGVPVDMKDCYMRKVNNEELRTISEYHKICRLCMKLVTCEFTSVGDLEVSLICKYIPEVNFSSTKDPIICRGCVDSVKTYGGFLRQHFDDQKYENICREDTMEGQFHIKSEEVEIKSEEDHQNTDTLRRSTSIDSSTDELPVSKAKDKDRPKPRPLKTGMYKCNLCGYASTVKRGLARHLLSHRKLFEGRTYKCKNCDFVVQCKASLGDKTTRDDIPKKPMYKCDTCNFETKYKTSLVKHQQRHTRQSVRSKSDPKSQVFRCDVCNFESKHKRAMANHRDNHVYVFNEQMYNMHTSRRTYGGRKKRPSLPASAATGGVGQRNRKTSVKVISVNIFRKP